MKSRTLRLGHGRLARWTYIVLCWPTVFRTSDKDRAYASWWVYRDDHDKDGRVYYRITPLAVLHRLTGLTLAFHDDFRFPSRRWTRGR